jgi:NO-binding membrane sensor protein with MHYT domain
MTLGEHTLWLVVLSVLVAMQAAFVALRLATTSKGRRGIALRLRIAAAALTLAVGIWGMHFIGLLAAPFADQVEYLVVPTVISFLVCAIVVGSGWIVMALPPQSTAKLVASAVLMGCGIAFMHYIGMHALHASLAMQHKPITVIISVVIGIFVSGLALWLAFAEGPKPPLMLSAAVFALAVSGMHYTAMYGLSFSLTPLPPASTSLFTSTTLALIVAVTAFAVSGIFLLALVPESSETIEFETASPELVSPREDKPGTPSGDRLTMAPLGGVGQTRPQAIAEIAVERQGASLRLPVERIAAIRANGHYTFIFDGEYEYFCGLGISELDSRLDKDQFMRVHRSHILRVDRVKSLRRAGDHGVAELNTKAPMSAPISRARYGALKSRLRAATARV